MMRINSCDWKAQCGVQEVKQNLVEPDKAKFLGYVVWYRERDEFLVSLQKFPRKWHKVFGFVWTKYPTHAKIFIDHRSALRAVADYDKAKAEVALLFDIEDQLLVVSDV